MTLVLSLYKSLHTTAVIHNLVNLSELKKLKTIRKGVEMVVITILGMCTESVRKFGVVWGDGCWGA